MLLKGRILYAVVTLLFVTSSCKKKDTNPTPYKANEYQFGVSVSIQSFSAFYAMKYNFLNNAGADTAIYTYGFAWFGTPYGTLSADSVELNGLGLTISDGIYQTTDTLSPAQTNFSWSVRGNQGGVDNVPSISYTDTSFYPAMETFILPKSINSQNPLTIPLKALNSFTQYVYSVQRSNYNLLHSPGGLYVGVITANAESLTISSSVLQSIANTGDTLYVTIAPVAITSQIINNSKPYFVVQSSYTAQTVIQ